MGGAGAEEDAGRMPAAAEAAEAGAPSAPPVVGGAAAGSGGVGGAAARVGAVARRGAAAGGGAAGMGGGARTRPKGGLLGGARARMQAAMQARGAAAWKEGDLVIVTEAAPLAWRNTNGVITRLCKKQAEVKVLDGPKKGLQKMIKFDLLMKTEVPDEAAEEEGEAGGGSETDKEMDDTDPKTSAGSGRKLAQLLMTNPGDWSE